VLLVKPQTYMNLSGEAVRPAADWWKIPVDRTIVVHDDMDLEPGVVRVKVGGGSGGHRGIDSCIRHLGSREFVRVRLGIGKHPRMPGERWVLSRIPSEMHEILAEAVVDARRAVELIVERGAALAMNETNRRTEETGS